MTTPEKPSLGEVLVEFQKAAARAMRDAIQQKNISEELVIGEQSLYAIREMDVNLRVGLDIQTGADKRILVDFDAVPETRSTVQFTVSTNPFDPVEGATVLVTRADPVRRPDKTNQFAVWVFDAEEKPIPGHDIEIHIKTNLGSESKKYKTEASGRLLFAINKEQGKLEIPTSSTTENIGLSKDGEWAIYVTAKLEGIPKPVQSDTYPIRETLV